MNYEDHCLAVDRYLAASKRLAAHLVKIADISNNKVEIDLALSLVALCLAGHDLAELEEYDKR